MGSGVDWNRTFLTAGGLRLRVGRHGAGRPLLLITGIGAHLGMWAPFLRLAGDRELIASDDVLGYSGGGVLAQELARRAPGRIRRLVLCAASPGLGGGPPRPLAAF